MSSCGWVCHRPGGMDLGSERPVVRAAVGPSMSWGPWTRPVARAAVGMQECTQIGENGLSAQPPPACRARLLVRPARKVRFYVRRRLQTALLRETVCAECAFA